MNYIIRTLSKNIYTMNGEIVEGDINEIIRPLIRDGNSVTLDGTPLFVSPIQAKVGDYVPAQRAVDEKGLGISDPISTTSDRIITTSKNISIFIVTIIIVIIYMIFKK